MFDAPFATITLFEGYTLATARMRQLLRLRAPHELDEGVLEELTIALLRVPKIPMNSTWCAGDEATATNNCVDIQFPCGRVKRFLKNNTQNKMRVGAKGTSQSLCTQHESLLLPKSTTSPPLPPKSVAPR